VDRAPDRRSGSKLATLSPIPPSTIPLKGRPAFRPSFGFLTALTVLAVSTASAAETAPVELGGETTVDRRGRRAYSQPAANLTWEDRAKFEVGDSLFNRNWVIAGASTTARDGLGPLFNARSCSACHSRDGRGRPPIGDEELVGLLFRLSVEREEWFVPEPRYGGQLQPFAVPGARGEGRVAIEVEEIARTFADGTAYALHAPRYRFADLAYGPLDEEVLVSPRVAPPVYGVGLLEQVPTDAILARADPDDEDGDGISGRPNFQVVDGERRLGCFGWKANQPTVRRQVAAAFLGDIGITSGDFPVEDRTPAQVDAGLGELPSGGEPEIDERRLDRVAFYVRHLAVPRRRGVGDATVERGWRAFRRLRCDACHVSTLRTGDDGPFPALAGQTIHPFTDLLLHDMGDELADGRPDEEAGPREWRTPPLWGIGLTETVNGHTRFLHDGRARSLEEAILWHGGEAESHRDAYRDLPKAEREALLEFLRNL